jgi:TPR repeat protein
MLCGSGVALDARAAVSHFRRAVEFGEAKGEECLAHCLLHSLACNQDQAEAARPDKHAADAGHAAAANEYGKLLERGCVVARNIAEAVRYFRLSSSGACPHGMFSLANMFHYGRHVEQDVCEAVRLYRLAAKGGVADASFALCKIYRHGAGASPVDQDLNLAVEGACIAAGRGFFGGLVQCRNWRHPQPHDRSPPPGPGTRP